jgi:hypothetical protein
MKSLKNIRFLTANFTQLKGLQMGIIGLFLIGTTLWADKNQGNLTLPILMTVIVIVLWVLAERHYRNHFGKVIRTAKSKKLEVVISLLFILFGLGAFILDTKELFPINFLGITFAVAIFIDYWRMTYKTREAYFNFLPWFSLVLVALSLLPLFGLDHLWKLIGFASPITGVMTFVGLLVLINGLLSHRYLVKSLSAVKEEK